METNAKNYKGTELIQSKDLIDKLIVNLSQPESNTFLVSKKVFLEIGTLKPEFILDKLIYAIEAKGTLQDIEISNVYLPLFNDLMSQTYNSHPEKNSILLNLQNKVVRFIENLIDQSIKLSTQFLNDEQMDLLEIREEQVQNAVSNLCKIYPQKMINIIQEIIDPTKPSNLFCLRLLNFVSDSQSQLIFPRINDILSRIMPSFSSIKSDELRIEYCNLIISLIDNLIMQKENQLGFNQESSSSLVLTIFDIIFGQWLQQAQLARARIGCLQSLGYLTHFLSQGKLLSIYEQLIQVYVFSYKKEPCEFFHRITVGFNKFLEKLLFMDKTYLDSLTKSILVSIHQLVTNPFMSSNSKFDPHNLKYKNELLITIQHLSVYSVDTVFDHYIGRLQNKERMEKICALWIIRHLLLRNYDKISENLKKMLNSYLQNLVYETDIEIRYVICEIALIFAQIGVFQVNPDSEYLLYFLLKQISIHELEIKERGQLAQEPFVTTLESLKIRSQQILTVIIKEPCSQEYLWPYILQFLTISQFSPGLVFICKSILQLIKKMQDVYPDCPVEVIHPKFSNHFINIKTDKIPKSQDIILRLVILLYKPYLFENLGYEIIQFLPIILPILHPSFTKIQKQPLNELRVLIKSEYDPTNQLFEKVDKVWLAILNTMNDQEWLQELNESLLNSYKFYQNNPEITGFICKLHGILLSRIDKLDHVKYAIEKMFCICHNEYSNNMINLSVQAQEPLANIRYSVAESFGYVASKHFDLLIDKVRSIFNSEIIGKKQQSAFNMFFSRQDDPDEISDSIKQTLILIIGYVAKHSDPSILTNKIEGSIINNIMPLLEKSQNYQLKCACQKALLLISQSLERVYLFTEGQINEEFKIFISKHRERILTKTQINFSSEKIGDLKIISLMTLCSLFRLDPPFGQDKYVNLFLDAIDIIPNVFDDTFQMFIKPIEELIYTVIHHDQIKTEVLNQDNTIEIKDISWWEMFSFVLSILVEKMRNAEPESRQDLLHIYFEQIQNALNNKKIKIKNKLEKKAFIKNLIMILSYVYLDDRQLRNTALLCVGKILIGVEVYESISFQSRTQINQFIYDSVIRKFQLPEIIQVLDEILLVITSKNPDVFVGLMELQSIILQGDRINIYDNHQLINNLLNFYKQIEESEDYDNDDQSSRLRQIESTLMILTQRDLVEMLDIFLKQKPEIPLHGCIAECLKKLSKIRPLVLKAFNYLTDVLNNPEHIISENVGAMMQNATIFIGQNLFIIFY